MAPQHKVNEEMKKSLFAFYYYYFILFYFILFLLFRATLAAYGGSQARGLIRTVAASLHHSSRQRHILNPLSEARDRTLVPIGASQDR